VAGVLRGLVAPWEIPRFIHANDVSLDAMTPALPSLDFARTMPSLQVPVFFFLGRYDHHVGSAIAARYFDVPHAPYRRLVWFDHSAHNPSFEEPARFGAAVTRTLQEIGVRLPAAMNRPGQRARCAPCVNQVLTWYPWLDAGCAGLSTSLAWGEQCARV
jgi:hypothetical protein